MQAVCERVGRGLRSPYSVLVFLARPEPRRERPPGARFAQRDQHHGQRPSAPSAPSRQARGGKTRCGAGALAGAVLALSHPVCPALASSRGTPELPLPSPGIVGDG